MNNSKLEKSGKGCGIGCGSLSLIAVLVIVGSYFFIDSRLNAITEIENDFVKIKDKFGEVEDFIPYQNGIIPTERIEKFITIRESISEERLELENSLTDLSAELKTLEDGESFFEMLFVVKELINTIPDIVEYVAVRNEKFLEMQMGLGEYYYIYVAGFYAWLNKDPGSGTEAIIVHKNREGISIGLTDEEKQPKYYGDAAIELRRERITEEANIFIKQILGNLDSAEDSIKTSGSGSFSLSTEHLSNFKDYRDRLEKSFSPLINPLEVVFISR
ncbi:MAG: hypothetical protein HND52_06775 [Ignavibacteriae bacterium]|nr:hypothetical protein [Ignavibacteriota bacterium]NOG97646.1 hypothetical protein [Ignavibacteriota bacterium]